MRVFLNEITLVISVKNLSHFKGQVQSLLIQHEADEHRWCPTETSSWSRLLKWGHEANRKGRLKSELYALCYSPLCLCLLRVEGWSIKRTTGINETNKSHDDTSIPIQHCKKKLIDSKKRRPFFRDSFVLCLWAVGV